MACAPRYFLVVPWPPHLTRTKHYLVEAMKLITLHGRMRCEKKPGALGEEYRITIVIDVPAPDELLSDRARRREHERTRG